MTVLTPCSWGQFFSYFQGLFLQEVLIRTKNNVDDQSLLPSLEMVMVITFFPQQNRVNASFFFFFSPTFLHYTLYLIPLIWLKFSFCNEFDFTVNKMEGMGIQPTVGSIHSMHSSSTLGWLMNTFERYPSCQSCHPVFN